MRISRAISKRQVVLFVGDVVLLSLVFYIAHRWAGVPCRMGLSALVFLGYLFSFYIFDLYDFRRDYRRLKKFARIVKGVLHGFVMSLFFLVFFRDLYWTDRMAFLCIPGLVMILLPLWRIMYSSILSLDVFDKKALILGTGENAMMAAQLLRNTPNAEINLVGFVSDLATNHESISTNLPVVGNFAELSRLVKDRSVDLLILALRYHQYSEKHLEIVEACTEKGVELMDVSTLYELLSGRVPFNCISERWILMMNHNLSQYYLSALKRCVDIVMSVILLLLLSPIVLFASVCIKLASPGGVFYRQERLGKNRVPFSVLKLRTMQPDAENGTPVWAKAEDPRVFGLGRILRKFRIDEIPQLINIIKGEMSLVGPRPERAYFVESLEQEIPYYGQRFRMKPGITGWAQVNYPYGSNVNDARRKLEYDLYYMKNNSFFLDIIVMLKTVRVVFGGRGR